MDFFILFRIYFTINLHFLIICLFAFVFDIKSSWSSPVLKIYFEFRIAWNKVENFWNASLACLAIFWVKKVFWCDCSFNIVKETIINILKFIWKVKSSFFEFFTIYTMNSHFSFWKNWKLQNIESVAHLIDHFFRCFIKVKLTDIFELHSNIHELAW